MKILIIGGVAGGATSAARLRRLDEKNSIILFEKGAYISYANCGLPYYIGGVIEEREKLFVQSAEEFGTRYGIDVRVNTEVLSIHPEEKLVKAKNLITGETYEETYDKLILSPGADPIVPPLPGIKSEGIFTIRNVTDTDYIKEYISTKNVQKAIVVGAGFIGLEMAENLHELGIQVSIVEMSDQVMGPLDYSMASIVHQHLKTKNVEFYLLDGVKSFEKLEDGSIIVELMSGRKITVDMVILSIGVKPTIKLAKESGLEIGEAGGIKVNPYLQTSNPDVYAVGDAIEFPSPITGKPFMNYLAGPANRQGRICADNIILGNVTEYKGSISTAIAKVFDITVASTGIASKILKKSGIKYLDSITHSASHAGYYPGAIPMTIKIIYQPETGKLFGAQVVGYDSVDKRLDLIASVVKKGGTIHDLIDIEHAYAPPYSSAKDPVNMAGYVAENILNGKVKIKHWRHVNAQETLNGTVYLDVRTKDEFELGSIPGAINIPIDDLRDNLHLLNKSNTIVAFCAVGLRGYLAARILMQNGFENVFNLNGGYKTWEYAVKKQSNEDIYKNLVVKKDDHIYQAQNKSVTVSSGNVIKVDACGLQCPGPIMKLKKVFDTADSGNVYEVLATDPGFAKDVVSWCNMTGNKLIDVTSNAGKISAIIEKAEQKKTSVQRNTQNGASFVVFSDDLDKALATFVLANGAASSGKKVTLFFTFWGLNIIKKAEKPSVKKDIVSRMFEMMMPSNSKNLALSKMNMFGIGSKMMRNQMKNKGVASLEQMMKDAQENGVEFVACQMSMDVMGVKKEELLDVVQTGGVATFLEKSDESNLNLFL